MIPFIARRDKSNRPFHRSSPAPLPPQADGRKREGWREGDGRVRIADDRVMNHWVEFTAFQLAFLSLFR